VNACDALDRRGIGAARGLRRRRCAHGNFGTTTRETMLRRGACASIALLEDSSGFCKEMHVFELSR